MASRSIFDLCAELRSAYVRFEAAMNHAGIDFIVTCTYRDRAEQQRLYNQGRTTPGVKVTNALPGQSLHNVTDENGQPASRAFDICIMKNGKCDWDVKNPNWQKAGEIGESVGLEWAGRWKSFREYPHFQIKKDA